LGIWTSFIIIPARITRAEGIANMPRAPLRNTRLIYDEKPSQEKAAVDKREKHHHHHFTYIYAETDLSVENNLNLN
jgi:hypothetical protein